MGGKGPGYSQLEQEMKESNYVGRMKIGISNAGFAVDKVLSVLQYLDSALSRSTYMAACNSDDPKELLKIIHERIEDTSIVSSMCQELVSVNHDLQRHVAELRERADRSQQREAQMSQFLVNVNHWMRSRSLELDQDFPVFSKDQSSLCLVGSTSFQEATSAMGGRVGGSKPATADMRAACKELQQHNLALMQRVLDLVKQRELADVREQEVVDEIVAELIEKRDATSNITEKVSHQISEYVRQQEEIFQVVTANISLHKKYELMKRQKKGLKVKVNQLQHILKKKDTEIEHLGKRCKSLESDMLHHEQNTAASDFAGKYDYKFDGGRRSLAEDLMELPRRDAVATSPMVGVRESCQNATTTTDMSSISSKESEATTGVRTSGSSPTRVAYITDYESGSKLLTRKVVDVNGVEKIQIIKTMEGSRLLKMWKEQNDNKVFAGYNAILQMKNHTDFSTTPTKSSLLLSLLGNSENADSEPPPPTSGLAGLVTNDNFISTHGLINPAVTGISSNYNQEHVPLEKYFKLSQKHSDFSITQDPMAHATTSSSTVSYSHRHRDSKNFTHVPTSLAHQSDELPGPPSSSPPTSVAGVTASPTLIAASSIPSPHTTITEASPSFDTTTDDVVSAPRGVINAFYNLFGGRTNK